MNPNSRRTLLLAFMLLPLCMISTAADTTTPSATAIPTPGPVHPVSSVPGETKAQRDARMAWWRDAKFGMFIHWGVYSVPAGFFKGKPVDGIGEWIMNRGRISMAGYQAFARDFNPVKFDPAGLVAAVKSAGMKYIVITAKHHDGFAMFDSKASNWTIVRATPYGNDPLKALADECRAQGIKLGFYYSQAQDWNNGGAAAGGKWDSAQEHSMDDYIDRTAVPQVTELLTNYGPDTPAVIWWDTPIDMTPARAARINDVVQKLRPGLIQNNRLGGGFAGDTETPEQYVPPQGYPGRDWETCMTINDTWGYKSNDTNFKSTKTLLLNLINIASKGGNYLLNVGPDATGVIPQPELDRLFAIGQWLKVNGDAIYGTHASPFKKQMSWGRVTQKPGKLYLSVFDWPKDGRLLVPVGNSVKRAWLLAQPAGELAVQSSTDGQTILLPATATDSVASVVELEIDGDPAVLSQDIEQDAGGTVQLKAADADLEGNDLQLYNTASVPYLGHWISLENAATWNNIHIQKPCVFDVVISYSLSPGSDGSEVVLNLGGQQLSFSPAVTGGWDNYREAPLGRFKISSPGRVSLIVNGVKKPGEAVVNIRSITFRPVTPEPAD